MSNEQIAIRAVENAETAAQLEIKDHELRDSLVRNFVQELDRFAGPAATAGSAGAMRAHEWPPLKKALWDVVTGETLNDGRYVNAYHLTDKLYAAALAAPQAQEGK